MNEKVYYAPSFDDAIKTLQAGRDPVAPRIVEGLSELLLHAAALAGRAYRRQIYGEYRRAQADVEHLLSLKAECERALAAAEAKLAGAAGGAWMQGAVFLLAFAACFAAEFVFNWAVLPWLLGVAPRSLLGLALAIAPATAPIILDRILARFLGVGDAISALAGAVSVRIRGIARGVFLAAAGVATLYSIWVLAAARAVASAVMANETALGPTPPQQDVLDLSLLLISLVLTINGALFYLFGVHDIKIALAVRAMRLDIGRIRGELAGHAQALAQAQPVLATARHAWDNIDTSEQKLVDTMIADGKVKLAQVMARTPAVPSACERVRLALGRRPLTAAAA